MNTTAQRVKALIANTADCGVDQIADDKSLADLGLDSMDRYELTLYLEEAFGIEILDKEAAHLNTVGEIVALVESKVKS